MRPASKELTYGWHRAEILGTLGSIIFLLTLTIWLVFEAMDRVIEKPTVKGFEMIITAVAGLGFNLIQMHILHQGEGGYQLGEKAGHGHSHGDGEGHGHAHEGGQLEYEGGDGHGHHGHGAEDKKEKKEHGHGHGHGGGDKKDDSPSKKKEKSKMGKSLAVDAAFLHALSDMIMSIGVCIAAGIIEAATKYYGLAVDENGENIDECAGELCYHL